MKVKLKPTSVIIANLGFQPGGDVQQFFTNTCALHMDKYVPFDTGTLAGTVVTDGTINTKNVYENAIVYKQEYASYVYYGLSKTGKKLNYQQDKHPDAGPYWDKRMWSAEKQQVIQEVQDYMKSRRK